jgi:hypothetical protein
MKESSYQDEKMEAYYREVRKLEGKFDGIKLHHILRHDKEEADTLAKFSSTQGRPLSSIILDVLDNPSI